MPTYEYRCKDCEKAFTVEARMSEPPPATGPGCTLKSCTIEKKMSRVTGFVKGRAAAPGESATRAAEPAKTADDPVHVCAKYCDHHAKA